MKKREKAASGSNQQYAEDYWAFSLAVYDYPEVAQACLILQNSAGVDVNVMLIALWAANRLGRAITREEISAGDREIAVWREEVVEPLRKIRTRLKEGFGGAHLDTDGLRNLVKSAELNAERVEQGMLAGWVSALPPGDEPLNLAGCTRTVGSVIDFYANKMNSVACMADLRHLSDKIAQAAMLHAFAH